MTGSIMFLDLATQSGFCDGVPGEKPTSGSFRLAPPGSSQAALAGGLIQFLALRWQAFRPSSVIYEAPRDPRHMGNRTNFATARTLIGLCTIAEGVAYRCGIYDVREVDVGTIRKFFLPSGSPTKGKEVKDAVIARCRELGFDPKDDNEADAIAGWFYSCLIIAPDSLPEMLRPLVLPLEKKSRRIAK